MPKLDLFLDENSYQAKLLASDVDTSDDEAYQLLFDALTGFMDGDAKTLIASSEFDITVHGRG